MLAPKSLLSWPLLQASVIAFQVSAGDGTITAPLERADSQTHNSATTARPATARPIRHRIGSSDRMRRTGDCRRPRPWPLTRARCTGPTVVVGALGALRAIGATLVSSAAR